MKGAKTLDLIVKAAVSIRRFWITNLASLVWWVTDLGIPTPIFQTKHLCRVSPIASPSPRNNDTCMIGVQCVIMNNVFRRFFFSGRGWWKTRRSCFPFFFSSQETLCECQLTWWLMPWLCKTASVFFSQLENQKEKNWSSYIGEGYSDKMSISNLKLVRGPYSTVLEGWGPNCLFRF